MGALVDRLNVKSRRMPGADRIWQLVGGVSVRAKILGIVLVLTAVLGLGVTWQVRAVMEYVFVNELENRGRSVVSDLAARSVEPILLNDTYALYELLQSTVANHPDVLYAFVVDTHGNVLAHTFGDDGFPPALLAANQAGDNGQIEHFFYRSQMGQTHDFAASIFDGRAGTVRLGLAENRLRAIINAVTSQMLLTTLVVALGGIAAAILLTWLLTRPVLDLVATTKWVGQGDLSIRAPHWADDEIGALADAFNRMVDELASNQQALAEKDAARTRLLDQLINIQEEERKRIARELHDGVGQTLMSFIVGLKLISQMDNPAAMAAKSEELHRQAAGTLEEVRLLSRQLRPSVLDDLGLAVALQRYADELAGLYPDIVVDLHCELSTRLPSVMETALYRIVQEAMTNAARHSSGDAVGVLVKRRVTDVQVIVEDNGQGFDPEQARREAHSVGIHSMEERAELVGGRLVIESSAEGTSVYVEVPV